MTPDLMTEIRSDALTWNGDEGEEREIERGELLTIVRDDEVGTHTTYVVRGADQERFTR
jgi:hypothetical protein